MRRAGRRISSWKTPSSAPSPRERPRQRNESGVGLIMAIGAYAGAHIIRRVHEKAFVYAVEGVMVDSGALLLAAG